MYVNVEVGEVAEGAQVIKAQGEDEVTKLGWLNLMKNVFEEKNAFVYF